MHAEQPDIDRWLQALPGAEKLAFWPPPTSLYSVARLYHGLTLQDPASATGVWDARIYDWTLSADGRARPFSPLGDRRDPPS